jgi:hypothetical protein
MAQGRAMSPPETGECLARPVSVLVATPRKRMQSREAPAGLAAGSSRGYQDLGELSGLA